MAIRYYDQTGPTRPEPSTAQLIGELSAQAERTRETHLADLIAGCTRKAA